MNWQSWRLENLNVPIIIIIIKGHITKATPKHPQTRHHTQDTPCSADWLA